MCCQITMVRGFREHVLKPNDLYWLVVLCYWIYNYKISQNKTCLCKSGWKSFLLKNRLLETSVLFFFSLIATIENPDNEIHDGASPYKDVVLGGHDEVIHT